MRERLHDVVTGRSSKTSQLEDRLKVLPKADLLLCEDSATQCCGALYARKKVFVSISRKFEGHHPEPEWSCCMAIAGSVCFTHMDCLGSKLDGLLTSL